MTILAKEGNTKDSETNNTRRDKVYDGGHLSAKPIIRAPLLKRLPIHHAKNGNIILDTEFSSILDVEKTEKEIKNIPGVIEVGLFSRKNNTQYYSVNREGKFSVKSS